MQRSLEEEGYEQWRRVACRFFNLNKTTSGMMMLVIKHGLGFRVCI